MTRVLFRVDAGQILHVATGHGFRCMALAEELTLHGIEIVFLMAEDDTGNALVRSRGWRVEVISDHRNIPSQVRQLEPDLVVFDLLVPKIDDMTPLRQQGLPVVVIHDLGHVNVDADLVVNGNILDSTHQFSGTTKTALLGPDYAVLGRDFDHRLHQRENPELESVLVTMGGADPMGFTPIVVDSLVQCAVAKSITVVLGPGFGPRSMPKIPQRSMKTQVQVQENVPDLSMLMMAADLVVSAGGRTAYELAATGTPGVLVPTAPHEVELAAAMATAGAALTVSAADGKSIRSELATLIRQAANLGTRRKLGRAGLDLIDGHGRQRIAQAILGLCQCHPTIGWERI